MRILRVERRLEAEKKLSEAEVEKFFIIACKKYGEEPNRRDELHLTDLCADCPRKVWYEKKSPLPDDPEAILRLWEGKAMHEASPLLLLKAM